MSRRANSEGSYTKLPSGKVRYRREVEIDGVITRPSFTGPSKAAAKKMFDDWYSSEAKKPIGKTETVSDWAMQWVEIYKKPLPGRSAGAYKDYKMYIERHIIPKIGDLKLTEVRQAHIQKVIKEARTRPTKVHPKGKHLSRSASEKLLWALRGIFETAIDNKLCHTSPVRKIELPNKSDKKPSVFKQDHIPLITDYLQVHEYGPQLAVYFYTGERPGEGFGLQWVDIDREKRTCHIRRSLSLVESDGKLIYEITPGTKNGKDRKIKYNPTLDKYLDQIHQDCEYVLARQTKDGYTHHTHKSFQTVYNRFFSDLNKKIQAEAKGTDEPPELIPHLSPHKMRHTFATYLRKGGAGLDEIREILGHSNITTTQIYDTIDLSDQEETVEKLPY